MRVQYKTHDGRFQFEFDVADELALFKELSKCQEIFDDNTCGACKGTDIHYRVREVSYTDERNGKPKLATATYYEKSCKTCRAKLEYGQKQDDQSLFPKKKDKEGNWLENNGWTKFSGKGNSDDGATKKSSGKKSAATETPF